MWTLKRWPPERVVMDPLVPNSFQNQRLTAAIGSLSLNLPTLNILVTVWLKTIAQSWEVSGRPHQKRGLMEALIRTKLHMTHLSVLKYSKKTHSCDLGPHLRHNTLWGPSHQAGLLGTNAGTPDHPGLAFTAELRKDACQPGGCLPALLHPCTQASDMQLLLQALWSLPVCCCLMLHRVKNIYPSKKQEGPRRGCLSQSRRWCGRSGPCSPQPRHVSAVVLAT